MPQIGGHAPGRTAGERILKDAVRISKMLRERSVIGAHEQMGTEELQIALELTQSIEVNIDLLQGIQIANFSHQMRRFGAHHLHGARPARASAVSPKVLAVRCREAVARNSGLSWVMTILLGREPCALFIHHGIALTF